MIKKIGAWFSSLFTSVFYPFQFKQDACTIKPIKGKKPNAIQPKSFTLTSEDVKTTQAKKSTKSTKPTKGTL